VLAGSNPLVVRRESGEDSHNRVAEEFEEGGGEQRVREFEGVAAGASQTVRLLQSPRDRHCSDMSGSRMSAVVT